jgi:hypothetical protein
MNCQSFENIIDDLARDQVIEASLRAEALRHGDDCSTCSARLAEERNLTLQLRALAREMDSVAAPERLESFLLAAFNEQMVSQSAPRAGRLRYASIAAAAVLLISLGVALTAWNSPFTQQAQIPSIALTNDPTVAIGIDQLSSMPGSNVSPEVVTSKNTEQLASVTRRTRRNKPTTTAPPTSVAEQEVATDFMPIGYLNSASLQDGGSVVRVELPRSTIVSMGFAVNMDRYGERVKADVLMGADGLARAIRFVQ